MDRAVSRRTLIRGAAAGTAAALGPQAAARAAGTREQRVEVAIVGAGAAGLYAADVLKGKRSLVILEASPRIGGRLLNGKIGPGRNDIAELGGEWVTTKQRIVRQLLRRYRLGVYPTYLNGKTTLILDGRCPASTRFRTCRRTRSRRWRPRTWSSQRWPRRSRSTRRGRPSTPRSGTA